MSPWSVELCSFFWAGASCIGSHILLCLDIFSNFKLETIQLKLVWGPRRWVLWSEMQKSKRRQTPNHANYVADRQRLWDLDFSLSTASCLITDSMSLTQYYTGDPEWWFTFWKCLFNVSWMHSHSVEVMILGGKFVSWTYKETKELESL